MGGRLQPIAVFGLIEMLLFILTRPSSTPIRRGAAAGSGMGLMGLGRETSQRVLLTTVEAVAGYAQGVVVVGHRSVRVLRHRDDGHRRPALRLARFGMEVFRPRRGRRIS